MVGCQEARLIHPNIGVSNRGQETIMDTKEGMRRILEKFGSREAHLGYQIVMLSQFGQPCDVTFYKKKPIINVKVDQQVALALMYGAGPKKLAELLNNIKFSDGTRAGLGEIWTVNAMPKEGFTDVELEAVDMSKGRTEGWS
jgi:hypothetical protein